MEILWTCCEKFLAALRRTYTSKKIAETKVQEYKGTSWTFVLHNTILIVMSGNLVCGDPAYMTQGLHDNFHLASSGYGRSANNQIWNLWK